MGAPQAAGQGLLQGSRPGALFRCPITPEEYDCKRVDIDGDGEINKQIFDYFVAVVLYIIINLSQCIRVAYKIM